MQQSIFWDLAKKKIKNKKLSNLQQIEVRGGRAVLFKKALVRFDVD